MMTKTIDFPCGCQVEVSYNWIDGVIETEITYKCELNGQIRARLLEALKKIEKVAKSPTYRTAYTQKQAISMWDDMLLLILEPAIADAEAKG